MFCTDKKHNENEYKEIGINSSSNDDNSEDHEHFDDIEDLLTTTIEGEVDAEEHLEIIATENEEIMQVGQENAQFQPIIVNPMVYGICMVAFKLENHVITLVEYGHDFHSSSLCWSIMQNLRKCLSCGDSIANHNYTVYDYDQGLPCATDWLKSLLA
mgnify:CR=1 FL=1